MGRRAEEDGPAAVAVSGLRGWSLVLSVRVVWRGAGGPRGRPRPRDALHSFDARVLCGWPLALPIRVGLAWLALGTALGRRIDKWMGKRYCQKWSRRLLPAGTSSEVEGTFCEQRIKSQTRLGAGWAPGLPQAA